MTKNLHKFGFGFMSLSAVAAVFMAALPVKAADLDGVKLDQSVSLVDCTATDGQAAVYVTVQNVKNDEGNLRAQIYSENPDEFLEKGKKLVRIEVPAQNGEAKMCVPLPSPGKYALVVMHDVNANGKADVFSEGFGFSNNPKLGLSKPDHSEVAFIADAGVSHFDVRLKYLMGTEKEKAKRRQSRRR